MLLLTLTTLAVLQLPAADSVYDSPATRALVERTIAASGQLPPGLSDYAAEVESSMYITIAPDSGAAGDLPASVDELVSRVRWERGGALHQEVHGHRLRLLVPLPYTLATLLRSPWVIPHLYGTGLERREAFTPFAGTRALHPFAATGPAYYRYAAGDTVRLRVQGELTTLVPVTVRPRVAPDDEDVNLVLGAFYLDVDRASVARARFGFTGRDGALPRTLGRTETFWELENGLWEGRYWLPFFQRREIVFHSDLLGGTITARTVSRFRDFALNTGWTPPPGPRVRLAWDLQDERAAFADWHAPVGVEAGEFSAEDFADLRLATSTDPFSDRPVRVQLHYARGGHLFRYNRVEGLFLGAGARLLPARPRDDRWELYGTAGWAFAERAARGEVAGAWGAAVTRTAGLQAATEWGAHGAVFRRLQDIQPFRPSFNWDWIYTLPAALWGVDERDYYDAKGAELFGVAYRGRWNARLGGRVESHDSVRIQTTHFLFGEAEEFGPLAQAEPGTHAAVEAGAGYARGPGAFGIGNSAVARAEVEVGVGDFSFRRLTGLLSVRYNLGPVAFAARGDAGHAWGTPPPQKLFRFGSVEGLRGYEPNEFGGSTAVLGRARLILGIPPRSSEPLARFDVFLIPPLRPSLVLLAESGWTRVDDDLGDELARLRARPTDGARSSVGAGISFLEDAFTIEYLQPVNDDERRGGRWYLGLATWY